MAKYCAWCDEDMLTSEVFHSGDETICDRCAEADWEQWTEHQNESV